jgi:hypothetical protein
MDLRQRILGAGPKVIPVPIPEWGEAVEVGVRSLSLTERLAFEIENGPLEEIDRKKDPAAYNRWLVRYVLASACDLTGKRLFHPEDEAQLAQQAATAIERLCLAAMRVNVVTAAEVARVGEASGEARNGASPSDSPVTSG